MPDARYYLDFTGTGNSLNASNPEARAPDRRFAALLGGARCTSTAFASISPRRSGGCGRGEFSRHAPLFQIIAQDPGPLAGEADRRAVGRGPRRLPGRQLSGPVSRVERALPRRLRRYWKGDDNLASRARLPADRVGRSVPGRAARSRRPASTSSPRTTGSRCTISSPTASKHNEANGEHNHDGADDNQSWNHGVEGETDDPAIIALRERQKRNLLATLFLSQGVPMLLGGDEMGRTQRGNNNAYCQDNEISWFDWKLDDRRRGLLEFTRRLIALRQRHPVAAAAARSSWATSSGSRSSKDLAWLRPDGAEMTPQDWQKPWISALAFMLGGDAIPMTDERGERLLDDGLLILMNAHHEPIAFKLPAEAEGGPWLLELDTGDPTRPAGTPCASEYEVAARAMAGAAAAAGPEALAREAAAAPARVAKKRGAAAAAARRRADAAVLDPHRDGLGHRRHRRTSRVRAPGRSQAGFSVLQLLPVNARRRRRPQPVRGAVGVRARSGLPVARRAAKTSRPRADATRCPRRAAQRRGGGGAARRLGAAVRAVKDAGDRAWRSSASCATNGASNRRGRSSWPRS